REVQEAFWYGDVCPQYGSVNIIYLNIKKADCDSIGEPIYSSFWGLQYRGCTPLISRGGTLIGRGFSWSIRLVRDEDRTKTSIEEPLLFDSTSECTEGAEKLPCGEFHEGQKVFIKATRSGQSLAVLRLDITSALPDAGHNFHCEICPSN